MILRPPALRAVFRSTAMLLIAALWVAMGLEVRGQDAAVRQMTPRERIEQFRKVDAYLQRLALVDQRIILAERTLEQGVPPADRSGLVRSVSDLYAARLLALSED